MTTKCKYNLHDDSLNGWGFELDFTEWNTDIIVQWIEILDDDFGDDYEEKFNIQSITGHHFQRNKLGNALWCRKELGMDPLTANCFSLIVRQRITKYEHIQNNIPKIQPQISIDNIELLPMSSIYNPDQISITKGYLKSDSIHTNNVNNSVNKNRKHIKINSSTFHTSKAKDFTNNLCDNDLNYQNEEDSDEELEPGFDFFATRSDGDIFIRSNSHNTIRNNMNRSQSYHPTLNNPNNIDELYLKAVSLYENKHYEECEKCLNSVLNIDNKHIQAVALSKELSIKQNKQMQYKKQYKRERYHTIHTISFTRNTNSKNKNKKQKRKFTFGRKNKISKTKDKSKKKQKSLFIFGRKTKIKTEKEEQKKQVTDVLIKKESEIKFENDAIYRCQIEFERFLTRRVGLSNHYQDLEERFKIAGYDDIRLLKDFNHDTLDEIGLKTLHIKCFLRKIDIFMNEVKCFQDWLKRIIIKYNILDGDGIIDLLENNGILTFEQLYRYVESMDDLEKMMKNRGNDCKILWNEIENIQNKETENISLVEQQKMIYDDVNSVFLDTFGYTSGYPFNGVSNGNEVALSDAAYVTPQ